MKLFLPKAPSPKAALAHTCLATWATWWPACITASLLVFPTWPLAERWGLDLMISSDLPLAGSLLLLFKERMNPKVVAISLPLVFKKIFLKGP